MTSLDDLLTVQALDTRVDQTRHRRLTLPERGELDTARARLSEAERTEQDCSTRLRAVRSAQKESEDHASLLDDKAAEVQRSLYDGSVTSPKELEALQLEHRTLKEHQGDHEDRALELMEQGEPIETELAGCATEVARLCEEIERLEQVITVAEAELDAEIDETLGERAAAAAGVPAEILAAYDTLRRQLGGVGAARLVGARCEGCHLEIPSAQLEQVRRAPLDSMVTCPECLRILVR